MEQKTGCGGHILREEHVSGRREYLTVKPCCEEAGDSNWSRNQVK